MIQTINDWKPEVRGLLKTLIKHGCKIIHSNNGDDCIEDGIVNFADVSLSKFVEHTIACDEAWIQVEIEGARRNIYLVFGNSPGELICDYGCHDVLDKVCDEHSEKWSERPQPKLRGGYVGGKFLKEEAYRNAHRALVGEVNRVIHHRNLFVRIGDTGTRRVIDCQLTVNGDVMVRGLDDGHLYEVYYNRFMDGNGNDVKFERVR